MASGLVQLRRHRPRGHDPPPQRERGRRARDRHPAAARRLGRRRHHRARAQPRRRARGPARGPARPATTCASPRSSSAPAARRPSGRACASPGRTSGRPGHPSLQTLRLTVPRRVRLACEGRPARPALARRAAVAQRPAGCGSTARRCRRTPRAAATRSRPPTWTRVVRRLQAIGADATRAQHPLNPALLERLDAAGILVWQGIGPVDSPGAWTATTPALRRRACGASGSTSLQAPHAPERADVEPRQRGRQQRPRRRPGAVHRLGRAARAPPRARPPDRRRRLGHAPARPTPGHLPQRRRDRRDQLRGLVRRPHAAGDGAAPHRRLARAGCSAAFPDKVLVVTRVRRRGKRAATRPAPGGLDFQAA